MRLKQLLGKVFDLVARDVRLQPSELLCIFQRQRYCSDEPLGTVAFRLMEVAIQRGNRRVHSAIEVSVKRCGCASPYRQARCIAPRGVGGRGVPCTRALVADDPADSPKPFTPWLNRSCYLGCESSTSIDIPRLNPLEKPLPFRFARGMGRALHVPLRDYVSKPRGEEKVPFDSVLDSTRYCDSTRAWAPYSHAVGTNSLDTVHGRRSREKARATGKQKHNHKVVHVDLEGKEGRSRRESGDSSREH